ncbi:hypothetical protein ACFW5V_31470 [Streptomyces sp. NPDC058762]|uniref:hypothetical protein n=1 Tax=Streptomyces sp. NPDC058762 TaxID=3346629 RepID=UPI00369617F2
MRRTLMPVAATAVAMVALGAAPAHATASAVYMDFGMSYGATTTSGTIHFTDGYTASVSAAVHAVSGPKRICVTGWNGDAHDGPYCSAYDEPGGSNQGFSKELRIALPGGVQEVTIFLNSDTATLKKEKCTRNGCSLF